MARRSKKITHTGYIDDIYLRKESTPHQIAETIREAISNITEEADDLRASIIWETLKTRVEGEWVYNTSYLSSGDMEEFLGLKVRVSVLTRVEG